MTQGWSPVYTLNYVAWPWIAGNNKWWTRAPTTRSNMLNFEAQTREVKIKRRWIKSAEQIDLKENYLGFRCSTKIPCRSMWHNYIFISEADLYRSCHDRWAEEPGELVSWQEARGAAHEDRAGRTDRPSRGVLEWEPEVKMGWSKYKWALILGKSNL